MRIGLVFDGDYPWDIRIEKFASALTEQGYEVHILCRNLGRRPMHEVLGLVHIHRLPVFGSSRLNRVLTFPAFFNPVWIRSLRRIVVGCHLNLIIVRDLPLALTAALIGKISGVPVILDMAENYPDMLRDIRSSDQFSYGNLVVRNPYLAELIESVALKAVNHTFVVVEESKKRLISRGASPARISVIGNVPVVASAAGAAGLSAEEPDSVHLRLVYVGGLEPLRGLDLLLMSLPDVVARIPEFTFSIIGDGKWRSSLQHLVQNLGLDKAVTFTGRLSHELALQHVQAADVGIIPHRVTPFTNTTIPNKLFDYMMFGKPVVSSDMTPVQRVIESVGCGYCYNDSYSLLTSLLELRKVAVRRTLGENGRRAVISTYNWKRESIGLIETVQRLSPRIA